MYAFNDDRCRIVDETMGTSITDCWIRLMEVTRNILITFDTLLFAFAVQPMEFSAYILPGRRSKNLAIVIDDGSWKWVDLFQPIMKQLKLFNIDQILKLQRHEKRLRIFRREVDLNVRIVPDLSDRHVKVAESMTIVNNEPGTNQDHY